MLEVDSLTFSYPYTTPIFQDFNWQVRRGETWSVLGTSGCGKTTLLYLLAGLLMPASGQIIIDGRPLIRPRPHTGLILQEYGLLPWASVRDNAALGLRVRNFYGPDGTHAPDEYRRTAIDIDHWLKRLGITSIADKFPGQISGGQRQRTAIARTLAIQPDLLLMDEPFSSLDAVIREDLQNLTLELCREQGITLVIVTHAIEEAAVFGQNILLLGTPPNKQPAIIENPACTKPDYRQSDDYRSIVKTLRAQMVSI